MVGYAASAQIPISTIVNCFQASRQYVYILRDRISQAAGNPPELVQNLCRCFFPDQQAVITDDRFFEKMILSLALDGTSSIEGIRRVLENVFHKHVSIGSIRAVLNRAADKAQEFDRSIDLSAIHQGANDGIFQCGIPVLTGVDPVSAYMYLLKPVSDRSADTWKDAMEDCKEQNLNLEVSISDFGKGLLSGIPKAFTGIEFQGDLFHWLTELGKEISSQERKAYALLSEYYRKLDAISGQRVHEKTFGRLLSLEEKLADSIDTSGLLQIRRYMNLKRIIPEKFLTLLKVYFHTRQYRRSRKKERVGKNPLKLLTGQKHPDFYDIVLGR